MFEIGVYKATTFNASGPHHIAQIGEDFAAQYYLTLCISPQTTYKFYKEESIMSRPKNQGICTITTIKDIQNELLLSEMRNNTVILLSTHSQNTIAESIIVGVVGLLRKDGTQRRFHQSFLLAPEATAFYVKNDLLRFIGAEYNEVSSDTSGETDADVNQASETVAPATSESSTSTRITKSILVKNLPPTVTRKSIARAVRDFGRVKFKNIHIRAYDDDYTYAFVEFHTLEAASQAVEAGFINIDGWECDVEHKESHTEEL